jgi:lysophospholipase L1-like esterase
MARRGEAALLVAGVLAALVLAEAAVRGLGLAERRPTGYAPVNTKGDAAEPVNSGGYRDLERDPVKPRGVRRLLSLGDSFAWGVGVEFEDAYPQRVERALNRRGEAWEVVNLALRGMNTEMQAAQLRDVGLAYEPDVVVVGYVLNDAEETQAMAARQARYAEEWRQRKDEKRRRRTEGPPLHERSALFRWVRTRIEATGANRRSIEDYIFMYGDAAPGWLAAQRALGEMGAACRGRGIPLVVLVFPKLALPSMGMSLDDRYPFAAIHAKIACAAAEAGAKVVDLLPAYRGLLWEVLVADGVDDEHPNEIAHRIATRSLIAALDEVVPAKTAP